MRCVSRVPPCRKAEVFSPSLCVHLPHAERCSFIASHRYDGLGILAVKNVPGFVERREALIPLARQVAMLPDEEKAKIEDPESSYSVGWSHGKEKFIGKPDYSKGSFYGNPLHDRVTDDEELIRQRVWFG